MDVAEASVIVWPGNSFLLQCLICVVCVATDIIGVAAEVRELIVRIGHRRHNHFLLLLQIQFIGLLLPIILLALGHSLLGEIGLVRSASEPGIDVGAVEGFAPTLLRNRPLLLPLLLAPLAVPLAPHSDIK